jgi:phage protein D
VTVVSQLRSGLPPTDYYAPNFQVEVEGRELDPQTQGDVLDVKVTMDLENLTSFDLTFNNWDDRTLSFKYSDTDTLDVGRRVRIKLGYAGRMVPMVRGMITSLTPRFPESGPPTIAVSGQDLMFLLKGSKPKDGVPRQYTNVQDWRIAEEVARRHNLTSKVTQDGPTQDLVIQKNQDDAQFLMERAKRIDFDVYVQTDPDTGQDALYFVRPTDGRAGTTIKAYEFAWGRTLMEFSPTLTIAGQVSHVTVRGWNPRTKQAITATADASDLPGGAGQGQSGPAALTKAVPAGKEDRVVDAPVTSGEEAKALAVSLLREKAGEHITASGKVIGLPDLRPGDNVQLTGLGKRFSGPYFVKKVEHSLGVSGYLTQFEVRNFVDGGTQ